MALLRVHRLQLLTAGAAGEAALHKSLDKLLSVRTRRCNAHACVRWPACTPDHLQRRRNYLVRQDVQYGAALMGAWTLWASQSTCSQFAVVLGPDAFHYDAPRAWKRLHFHRVRLCARLYGQEAAKGRRLPEASLVMAVENALMALMWRLNALEAADAAKSPSASSVASLGRAATSFGRQLDHMGAAEDSEPVLDAITRVQADFFLVFSAEKLKVPLALHLLSLCWRHAAFAQNATAELMHLL